MAELPRRHAAATLRLKELIATRLGPPRLLFCHLRVAIPELSGPLRNRCLTARTTHDLIELVDWCRYVVGSEPTSVVGVHYTPVRESPGRPVPDDEPRFRRRSPVPDRVRWHRLAAATTCRLNGREAITFRPPAALQVCCENGVAFVDLPANLVWFDQAGRHMESLETERPVGEQLLALFHRAVTSLVRKTNELEDAYRALHHRAQRRSQRTRRTAHSARVLNGPA